MEQSKPVCAVLDAHAFEHRQIAVAVDDNERYRRTIERSEVDKRIREIVMR